MTTTAAHHSHEEAASQDIRSVSQTGVPERTVRELAPLLGIACLLTVSGGYLDAYAWMAHHHVFANAQTGNVVFFGLELAQGDRRAAMSHLVPMLAFTVGVIAAKLLGVKPVKHTYRATLVCLAIELAWLCGLCGLRNVLPEPWFVPSISFVVALQITSFSQLGPLTFNSAMTTGNLLNAITGLFGWVHEREERGRVRGALAAAVVSSFAAGAFLGGIVTQRWPTAALLPCIVLVGTAMALLWHQHANATEATRRAAA